MTYVVCGRRQLGQPVTDPELVTDEDEAYAQLQANQKQNWADPAVQQQYWSLVDSTDKHGWDWHPGWDPPSTTTTKPSTTSKPAAPTSSAYAPSVRPKTGGVSGTTLAVGATLLLVAIGGAYYVASR